MFTDMKAVRMLVVMGFMLFTTLSFGQDYAFKVMANKGNNEVKSGDAWQPLKTGASLRAGDELKLADNGYVGLIHASGKPVEVKKPGAHKVADLAEQVKGGSSAINKYTDFILSSNANDKKGKLGATGAVHRATESALIKVALPESQYSGVYNNTVVINWDPSVVTGPYAVSFENMFGDKLDMVETTETGIRVDLSQPKFADETAVLVIVSSKADPKQNSKQYTVKRLNSTEKEKVKKLLNDIMGEVAEPSALNHFILAGFYESQGLLIDAITSYDDAVKIESAYQEDYDSFLMRNGLKK
jgi:hypothetical protein